MIRKLYYSCVLFLTAFPAIVHGQANAVDAAVHGYIFDSSQITSQEDV